MRLTVTVTPTSSQGLWTWFKKIKLPLVHILCLFSLVDMLCEEDSKELYQYHLIGMHCRILTNCATT